jgi:hypothetical protein
MLAEGGKAWIWKEASKSPSVLPDKARFETVNQLRTCASRHSPNVDAQSILRVFDSTTGWSLGLLQGGRPLSKNVVSRFPERSFGMISV